MRAGGVRARGESASEPTIYIVAYGSNRARIESPNRATGARHQKGNTAVNVRNTARRLESGGVRPDHFLEDLKKLNKAAMVEIGAQPGGLTSVRQSSARPLVRTRAPTDNVADNDNVMIMT